MTLMLTLASLFVLALALQCLAAPTPPNKQTLPQFSSHLDGNMQPHQHSQQQHIEAIHSNAHHTSFEQDLDIFLNEWLNHPNPSSLLPSPGRDTLVSHSSKDHSSPTYLQDDVFSGGSLPSPVTSGKAQSSLQHDNKSNSASSSPDRHKEVGSSKEGDWRDVSDGQLSRLYQIYIDRVGGGRSNAYKRFKNRATPQVVRDLLSGDPARVEASIKILGIPSSRSGNRQRYLGSKANEVTREFAKYHNITRSQAISLLARRLTKQTADLLLNPDRFEEGANALKPVLRHKSPGWTPELRALMKDGDADGESQDAQQSTLSGQKRKFNDAGKGKAHFSKGYINGTVFKERVKAFAHAESILAPKIISKMAAAYRRYFHCHPTTAHKYIREYINAHPDHADQLSKELLSTDNHRIAYAASLIGRPLVQNKLSSSLLSKELRRQIEEDVMKEKNVKRNSAQSYLWSGLTKDIAKELQDPEKRSAAVQKLLNSPQQDFSRRGKSRWALHNQGESSTSMN